MPIGEQVGDVPPRSLVDVPQEDRSAAVYCGPHGTKPRVLVAVLTKQGRLLTSNEDINWVEPPYDDVLAACDRCSLPSGERHLSVEKLRARLATGPREVPLDEILAD